MPGSPNCFEPSVGSPSVSFNSSIDFSHQGALNSHYNPKLAHTMRLPSKHFSLCSSSLGWLFASLTLLAAASAQGTSLFGENPLGLDTAKDSGGTYSWQADNANKLGQQWFWYRIDAPT